MNLKQQLEAGLAGRYDIDREIGAGGMATVFLASDVRHHRKVAVKVLNPELGAVLGAERFLSEIRVTANLQHPNLLPLFDSGETEGLLFYVMPFVEGETLRARLEREKQLPIDEAVRISTAIASALDYAHRHGVIHRDLKPENILLHDGQPLIADFGIALAVSNAGGARVTQTGLSLGTPQYMSPEQATGDRGIDGRTDIYSLGALTYEMLVGEPPHTGTNAQAIIAKLMTEDPRPISVQRRSVPEHVEAAVECALEKLPADRFATAKDFSDALNGKSTAHPTTSLAKRAAAKRRTSPALIVAVALVAGGLGALAVWVLRPARLEQSVAFPLTFPPPMGYVSLQGRELAFSPDGKAIAFGFTGDGSGIAIRRLDAVRPQLLPGTEGAADPSFSPDGKRLAFYRNSKLFTVAIDGTAPTELATIGSWNGLTWLNERTIVYEVADTLWAIDPVSAVKRVVTVIDTAAREADINSPLGMPDGRTVSFVASDKTGGDGSNHVAFVSLDGSNRVVTPIAGRPSGYLDGWLIYDAPGMGMTAVRVDLGSRKQKGDPIRIADTAFTRSSFSVAISRRGDIAYASGARTRRVVVLGSRGEEIAATPDEGQYAYPSWSPDGQRVVYSTPVPGKPAQGSLWIFDVRTGTTARLATSVSASRAVWSADGKRIFFVESTPVLQRVFSVPSDGSAAESVQYAAPNMMVREVAVTPDGKSLVLTVNPPDALSKRDLVLVPLDGSKTVALVAGSAEEKQPAVSRDGRWLAYMSDESGRPEVYVRSMTIRGGSAMISKGGGQSPRWTSDGRVVYVTGTGTFRRVALTTVGGLPAAGKRDSLFTTLFNGNTLHQNYDISADDRFVIIQTTSSSDSQVMIVTNWWQRTLARLKGGQ